jgi:hypothetical protein
MASRVMGRQAGYIATLLRLNDWKAIFSVASSCYVVLRCATLFTQGRAIGAN